MKRKPKTEKALAGRWGCDVRTIRRWKRDGAPLGDDGAMVSWLSTRKNLPPGTQALLAASPVHPKAEPSPTPDGPPGSTGAPSALVRLENAELRAWQRFESATATGDLVAAKAARQGWLEVGRELRRYDLQVERERRQGDMIPAADAQSVLQSIAWHLRNNLRDGVLHATSRLLSSEQGTTVTPILSSVIDSYLLSVGSVLSGCGLVNGQPLPPWAKAALEKQLANQFPKTSLETQGEQVREIVKAITAWQAEALVEQRKAK